MFLAIKVVYGTVRTRVQRTVRVQLSGVLPFFVPYESTFVLSKVLSYVRILSTRTRTGTSVRRYLRTYKLSIRHTAVHVRVRVQ